MTIPFRRWLLTIGEHLNANQIRNVKGVVKFLEMGFLMHKVHWKCKKWVDRREELFDMVGSEVCTRVVLYQEFGVHQGETTRYWSKMLKNPQSKLHGFDSFEGLPETWVGRHPKGYFSTNGRLPVIDDPRIQFFKGWFEETLPKYEMPSHEVLVLIFDADLYSSTKCVLDYISPHIVPGTYLYFDEFGMLLDEFRAFWDFCSASKLKFELVGAERTMEHALFRCVA